MSRSSLDQKATMMCSRATKALLSAPVDWVNKCMPWLDEDGALYQTQNLSHPPIKDFYMIWVDVYQIIFTIWAIRSPYMKSGNDNMGANSFKSTYPNFKTNGTMRGMIESRAGERELIFLENLMNGHINYLDRLPDKVVSYLIQFLDMKSVVALTRASKRYKSLCNDNDIWRHLYMTSDLKPYMTQGLMEMVQPQGWKITYQMAFRVKKSVSPVSNESRMSRTSAGFSQTQRKQ